MTYSYRSLANMSDYGCLGYGTLIGFGMWQKEVRGL